MPAPAIDIVPVIDIKHGVVVRARAGDRDSYAPIVTPLSATHNPVDVARGLLGAVPARHLYIADLDGIEGRGRDLPAIRRIARACPEVELWVDAGFAEEGETQAFLAAGLGKPVLGSESQTGTDLVRALRQHAILSLDFRGEAFVGPPALYADASLWPDTVIVMTLARVGAGSGPDLRRLSDIRARAPGLDVFAAGGLRGPEDLVDLAAAGVAGVLVATALHEGRLRREHLATGPRVGRIPSSPE